MFASADRGNTLLDDMISAAVPLWILKIESEQWSPDRRVTEAHECADVIVSKGDILQFGGGKRGEVAKAFNALAKGLACLAFAPGGVTFGRNHWAAGPANEAQKRSSSSPPPPPPPPPFRKSPPIPPPPTMRVLPIPPPPPPPRKK